MSALVVRNLTAQILPAKYVVVTTVDIRLVEGTCLWKVHVPCVLRRHNTKAETGAGVRGTRPSPSVP